MERAAVALSRFLFSITSLSVFILVVVRPAHASVPVRVNELNKMSVRAWEDDFLQENKPCQRRGDYGYPRCAPGLWCVGNGNLTCQKRAKPNGSCADDPNRCGAQLKCENGICVPHLLPFSSALYIQRDQPCSTNSYQRCRPGLWCVAGACRKLVPCGGRCDNVRLRCRLGLACHHIAGKKFRFCRPVAGEKAVKHRGENCETGGVPCKRGFKCVVRAGVGTCRRPCRIGQPCGDKESDCEKGRECKSINGQRKCVQIMQRGETCGDDYSLYCDTGLTCSCESTAPCTTGKCT